MKEWLMDIIQGVLDKLLNRCEKCGSWDVRYGTRWTRAWNNLCDQASGDSGTRCRDCGHISWDKSLEEYKKTLPNWVVAYEEKEETKHDNT